MADRQMRLLSFAVTKINAEAAKKHTEKLQVSSDIDILNVEQEPAGILSQQPLKISYKFKVDYADLGFVTLEGFIVLMFDDETSNAIVKEWAAGKKLSPVIRMAILNILLRKCSLRALEIEEELGLPLHIQMPILKAKEKEAK